MADLSITMATCSRHAPPGCTDVQQTPPSVAVALDQHDLHAEVAGGKAAE